MKKLITILALLPLVGMAQTNTNVPGVTLSGNPDNPVIENHSGKQIIAVEITNMLSEGIPAIENRFFTRTPNELPDGKSQSIGKYARNHTAVSARITAVIFADGELRGDGEKNSFRQAVETRLQSMREVFDLAKHGNWDGVKSRAGVEYPGDWMSIGFAQRLLSARSKGQDVIGANEHVEQFPVSIWKAGLLNWLQRLPGLDQLAAWLSPVAALAQSRPYNNVQPFPYHGYNPPYYPNMWTYYCSTYLGSNVACPSFGGTTGYDGISAHCLDNGGYDIGVKTAASVDVFNLTVFEGGSQSSVGPNYNLSGHGSCVDNDNVFPTEYWDYEQWCRGGGSQNVAPVKNYDGTVTICGAVNLGWGG